MDTMLTNGTTMNGDGAGRTASQSADIENAERAVPVVSVDELTVIFDGLAPGVYRYAGRVGNTELLRWAQAHSWSAWQVNGAGVKNKADFLAALKQAMHLPVWLGHNWDALDEALRDLDGQRAPGYLLVYDSPFAFAEGEPASWQAALDILRDAAAFWQERGQPFYTLLRHTHGAAPEIPLLR